MCRPAESLVKYNCVALRCVDYLIQSSLSGRQTGVQNCLTNSKEVHKPQRLQSWQPPT